MAVSPAIELRIVDASPVRVAAVTASPVLIGPAGDGLVAALGALERALRERLAGDERVRNAVLGPARELYRAFGIDPTKIRPSSEALLRRVLRGEMLPRISNAVDTANLLAASLALPIGLYDAAMIAPPVELRRGRSGETYAGIRKAEVHLEDRPVLVDRAGPFGNPTSDALRTAVTERTRALWLVIFAPRSTASERLTAHADTAAAALTAHVAPPGCRVEVATTIV